jgi:hypothetical protein
MGEGDVPVTELGADASSIRLDDGTDVEGPALDQDPQAGTGSRSPGATPEAALLLVAAVSAGALGQRGFSASGWGVVALLVVAALVGKPPTIADLRLAPIVAIAALASWALLDAAIAHAAHAALGDVLLLAGVATALWVGRRLDAAARHLLLGGLLAVGLLVAGSGWLGVVLRHPPWAAPAAGLWRAASTLTYANATAALLVPLALVALGLLVERPGSPAKVLAATGLLVGAAATLSRAGAAALLVGLGMLAVLAGVRATLRALPGPLLGTLVGLAGLLPSMPAGAPTRPVLAGCALAAGLGLALGWSWLPRPALAAGAVAMVVVLAGGLLLVSGTPAALGSAAAQLAKSRATFASPDRSAAAATALRQVAARPLTGTGPGHDALGWVGRDGRLRVSIYVHDEYLQVLSDLGVVGALLLLVVLATLARLVWRNRPRPTPAPGPHPSPAPPPAVSRAVWAGVVAGLGGLALHSGFDVVWHLPVIPLTAAVLVGVVTPSTRPPAAAPPATSLADATSHHKEGSA